MRLWWPRIGPTLRTYDEVGMLNKLRHWPHAVLRRDLPQRSASSLQIILLLFIGGLIGLPVGILTTSEIVTPIIPLICYPFLLGGIAAAALMLRRGHVSTEHRQVEAALRGSEEWLRLALTPHTWGYGSGTC